MAVDNLSGLDPNELAALNRAKAAAAALAATKNPAPTDRQVDSGIAGTGTTTTVSNVPALDKATLSYLNTIFGSEAAWINDPKLGPLIIQIAHDGLTDPSRIKDYLLTHAVDDNGQIQTVTSDKSWFGTTGSTVRGILVLQKTDPATYKENVTKVLNDSIIPTAIRLGIKLDPSSLQTIAETVYKNGWSTSQNLIENAITSQFHYDPKAADALAAAGKSAGGSVSKAAADFATIASDYGITLPSDPAQMDNFIKGAIGSNGTEESFRDWAKQQAIHAYPFLADAIKAGSTVKGYLGNYATNISNTLDIPSDSINWSDPKWQSLVNPIGATKLPNLNDVLTTIKTDPKYGYDQTMGAKNNAYDLAANIKRTFGFGA